MLVLMRESTSNGKQVRGQTQKPIRCAFSAAGPIGMFRMCHVCYSAAAATLCMPSVVFTLSFIWIDILYENKVTDLFF